jgi:glycosyltransferase involved in cell wall biosynthesis
MKEPPKVSILMVCYNHAPYIEAAVQSVLAQTFTDWELIIFDDGSTDGSSGIIARLRAAHSGVIRSAAHPGGQNRGIAASYRAAIALCAGEYTAFLEPDDEWLPDNLKRKVDVLAQSDEVALVYSDVEPFGEDRIIGMKRSYLRDILFVPAGRSYKASWRVLYISPIPSFSTAVVRRKLLRDIKFLARGEYEIWLDWFLWLQLGSSARFFFLPQKLVKWRLYGECHYNHFLEKKGRLNIKLFEIRYRLMFLWKLILKSDKPLNAALMVLWFMYGFSKRIVYYFKDKIGSPANGKIIDIGCGEGFNAYCLSKRNEVVGIDISSENITFARRKFPGVDFRVMNAEHLDFEDDIFDLAYCLDVFEHLDNLDRVISEIHRVLKSGGRLTVNVPYWKSEQWLLKLRPTYFDEIHHVRVFGEDALEKFLSDKKFSLIRKRRAGFLNHIFEYYMFTRKSSKKTQLAIGDWRENWKTKTLFIGLMFFDARLFDTPLKYCPLWLVTLPIGTLINFFGNIFLPKSLYYTFKKDV